MNQYDEILVSEWLRDGIAAAKAGRRAEARELLTRVVQVNEDSEQAWLWLSGVVDTDEERLICLENVLTLNPDNAQARAGVKWLREARGEGREAGDDDSPTGQATPDQDADFLTPDGCVYCGRVVDERDWQCPHCGGQLISLQFKQAEPSSAWRSLYVFWLLLGGVNLLELVLINLFWQSTDSSLYLPSRYRVFVVGAVVSGETTLETWLTNAQWVQAVRYALVGSAVLAALAALGLFLRLAQSHTLAVILITVQIVLAAALPLLGFSGYFLTLLRVVFTVVLAALLLQTVEELVKEERREWLETDRTCVTAMDYYTQGHFYARQGMWARALLHWQMALSAGVTGDKDGYFASMARAWAALGRYERALEHIDEAMRVSPTPQKWEPLRETLAQAGRRASEQA